MDINILYYDGQSTACVFMYYEADIVSDPLSTSNNMPSIHIVHSHTVGDSLHNTTSANHCIKPPCINFDSLASAHTLVFLFESMKFGQVARVPVCPFQSSNYLLDYWQTLATHTQLDLPTVTQCLDSTFLDCRTHTLTKFTVVFSPRLVRHKSVTIQVRERQRLTLKTFLYVKYSFS